MVGVVMRWLVWAAMLSMALLRCTGAEKPSGAPAAERREALRQQQFSNLIPLWQLVSALATSQAQLDVTSTLERQPGVMLAGRDLSGG